MGTGLSDRLETGETCSKGVEVPCGSALAEVLGTVIETVGVGT